MEILSKPHGGKGTAGGRQARGISGLMELGKAAVTGLAHAQPL